MTQSLRQRVSYHAHGFTLVELMIALTIGMLIMAGVMLIFTNNYQARVEMEKSNRQIENGRYAALLLTEDLRLAGYYGEFEPRSVQSLTEASPGPTTPVIATPNPCVTTATALVTGMLLPVQGYDNTANLSCITDRRDNTDVVVVRHASTCIQGDAECGAMSSGVTYFQASLCGDDTTKELGVATPLDNHFKIDTVASNLDLHKRDCKTKADLRRYQIHIYYIANNDKDSDGIPTLKRVELGSNGWSSPVPLVEGIEDLQVEYGMDVITDPGLKLVACDGSPDKYTPAPDAIATTYPEPCGTGVKANIWTNVVSVKFNLLARNTEKSADYTDTKTYALGFNANGALHTVGPFKDNIKRHVYEAVVKLDNPAGRKG